MKDLIGFAVGFVSFGITYLVAMLIKKAVLSVKEHMSRKKEQKRLVEKLTENKISRLESEILGLSKKIANLTGVEKNSDLVCEDKVKNDFAKDKPYSPHFMKEQVLEIYESKESVPVLAKKYEVEESTIYKIKRGDTWKKITHHKGGEEAKNYIKLKEISLQDKELIVKKVVTDPLFQFSDRKSAVKLSEKYNVRPDIIYKWRPYSPKRSLLRYKDVFDLQELRSIYEKHKKTKTLDEINDIFKELYDEERGHTQRLKAIIIAFFRLEYWED